MVRSHPRQRSRRSQNGAVGYFERSFEYLSNVVIILVEHLGWPAVVFLLGFWFVEKNATAKQKQEIIDQYILGKGLQQWYPLLIIVVIAIGLYVTQHRIHKRRVKALKEEMGRLAKWKSDHQEKKLGTQLHHTQESES